MSGNRKPQFNQQVLIDTTPMPDDIPKVTEIGASSAPLMSAAYFIGDRCRAYNDDYMKCKTESGGKGELECMREGRKVTRCAASVIKDINENCLKQFRSHWECLEQNNHQLWKCRVRERVLNECVFDKLGLKKVIPDSPEGQTPVHLRKSQIYAPPENTDSVALEQLQKESQEAFEKRQEVSKQRQEESKKRQEARKEQYEALWKKREAGVKD